MSEPREVAATADEVLPGLWHWRVSNSGIGGHVSSSHAVVTREGCVLVDPVRLDDAALASLPHPVATVLTARCHQRAAWRYRSELGAEVWLPEDASAADEEPDHTYTDGQMLPGGLRAFRTPGPEWPHYSFLYEGDPGIVFCSDLLMNDEAGLRFIEPSLHDDPGGDSGERRAPARATLRDPLLRARGADRRRPQGRAAPDAGADRADACGHRRADRSDRRSVTTRGASAYREARAAGEALRVAGGVSRGHHVAVRPLGQAAREGHRRRRADGHDDGGRTA